MTSMRAAVLLLGLGVSCRAQFAPPAVTISLDDAPEVRWDPLVKVFDVDYLRKAAAEVIDTTVPKWLYRAVKPLVKDLEKYIPQPYAGELRGLASHLGDVSDVIILNFAYEISAFCTSIVAQDKKGNVYHGRNLDYPHSVLRNLTMDVIFIKNGEVAYRGTSFAGYIGLWTGQSPNKFTVSGDQRVCVCLWSSGSDRWWNWWKNVVSALFFRRFPVSWLVREIYVSPNIVFCVTYADTGGGGGLSGRRDAPRQDSHHHGGVLHCGRGSSRRRGRHHQRPNGPRRYLATGSLDWRMVQSGDKL
ncbi:N-acylethanolamine-hydrolyzing acid amidase-like isoform X3 [Pseudoliparis swirei]|uniref:N-acylethanolamine-hydrolyzing acid amidase-like isoform X3 n=1 Tax=Pseudoliparis swirei TaxID=2059687 RepID=UPI0024BEC2A6|nr:N-acylethanolamine-hydrolyzing acid amidase-like isoform X3 [Pseudoliparis swirei]